MHTASIHHRGKYRAGGCVHAPSRVAPVVGRHQLPQGSSTHLLTSRRPTRPSPGWSAGACESLGYMLQNYASTHRMP